MVDQNLLTWGDPDDDYSDPRVQLQACREELTALRRQLAEEKSWRDAPRVSAGKVQDGRDALLLLPSEFLRGYEHLFHRALCSSGAGGGMEEGRGAAGDARLEVGRAHPGKVAGAGVRSDRGVGRDGRGAKPAKKRGPGRGWLVKDERALGEKERIDRSLRKLARSLRDGGEAGVGRDAISRCGSRDGNIQGGGMGGDGNVQDGRGDGTRAEDGRTGVRENAPENTPKFGTRTSGSRIRGEDAVGGKGGGCGRWVESGWKFCPWCGSKN